LASQLLMSRPGRPAGGFLYWVSGGLGHSLLVLLR